MAAKTQNTEVTRKDGQILSTPVIASEIIYKGTPTFVKAAGDAFSNDGTTNTLAAGDVFIGISIEQADNSNGAAGAEEVRTYLEGLFELTFSDSLTKANVGDDVFVNNTSDDNVVTITTDTSTNVQITIGKIAQVTGTNKAFVKLTNVFGKAVTL